MKPTGKKMEKNSSSFSAYTIDIQVFKVYYIYTNNNNKCTKGYRKENKAMNDKLAEYYINMRGSIKKDKKMEEVPYLEIIPAIEKYFNGMWAYEITNETFTPDGSAMFTTVVLYTPGHIYTGHSACRVKDFGFNHLFALLDACQVLIGKGNTQLPKSKTDPSEPDGSNSTYNMTPEEIMDAINNKNGTQAKNENYKDEHNMPAEETDIDKLAEPPHIPPSGEEPPVLEPPHEGGGIPDYDTPKPELNGFTQHQVDRMNKFKSKVGIINNVMWDNYIRTWSSGKLLDKKDIVPGNVEEFLQWAEKVSANL